jgi:DNA polymerase-1
MPGSEEGIGGGHGMDELAQRHLGHTCISFKEVCGTGKKAISFAEVPLDRATQYAAEDADVTWRLHRLLKPRLSAEGATRIYERVDRPLVAVVAGMERHGIKVDREKLAGLSQQFAEAIAALEARFTAWRAPFTIGSPKQLGEILFDQMGLKGGKKGKSGQYSTDQSVLEKLEARAWPLRARCWNGASSQAALDLYRGAAGRDQPGDGARSHQLQPCGAQTGRLSSTEPNLQNIPIRTEIGRQIRDCFVAEAGNVLLSADYSQIELRLAAHMADVPALKEAFAGRRTFTPPPRRNCSAMWTAKRAGGPRRSTSPSSTASAAGVWPGVWA